MWNIWPIKSLPVIETMEAMIGREPRLLHSPNLLAMTVSMVQDRSSISTCVIV